MGDFVLYSWIKNIYLSVKNGFIYERGSEKGIRESCSLLVIWIKSNEFASKIHVGR